ncbi:hypothetical protein J41TS12_41400 [Paenibacillus antibioticophila]|uniref:Uncharacterized protein n=1 Tax=Paenibacillus antibioticophila TaxID=1274374 RepID=A0A920CJD0_9BACL|nr:hypothetical protein [Paenibacillus antibioticophila]GIO39279.1 hypothetical protein J41TS12_41400 [Paenibacillus antibioticophila]
MEKILIDAFEKLQKREHLLKVIREQRGLGRITQEEFKKQEAQILDRYRLTLGEERAYDLYLRMKGKRSSK